MITERGVQQPGKGAARTVLEVIDLQTYFFLRRGVVKAVDGATFSVNEGETLGLVGESGCGKSVTGLSILRLVPEPTGRIVGGKVIFKGENLLRKSERQMQKIRGSKISMILQDPMASLNPLFTVGDQVAEPIKWHQKLGRRETNEKVKDMLRLVKIPSPEVRMRDFPHQMSGGMRQRIMGALALSCKPLLLIADEPTTALDVTIQAQFLTLLKDIQHELGVAMIMITHDFGIVAKVCQRVAVMYAGKIVEIADVHELFSSPAHPYTIALMTCLPKVEQKVERLCTIEGQPPDLCNLPPGCAFAARCVNRQEICKKEYPPQSTVRNGHLVNCWLYARRGMANE